MKGAKTTLVSFADLQGWAAEDHSAALSVYERSCALLDGWPTPAPGQSARDFFEQAFQPVRRTDGGTPLFTGYFEPVLEAALQPDQGYSVPIYTPPSDASIAPISPTRAQIDAGAIAGQSRELAWARDAVEVFFLHIQGSGRLSLPDGTTLRIGYAGRNGHPYRSIGKMLIAKGAFTEDTISAQGIKTWLRAHPDQAAQVMAYNPSFIFFHALPDLLPKDGPLGTLGCPLVAGRSAAIDPAFTPLGTPIWVQRPGDARLWIAQDTGGAIKGAQRADFFMGTGQDAGLRAGALKVSGGMVVLLPHALAAQVGGV